MFHLNSVFFFLGLFGKVVGEKLRDQLWPQL